MNLALLLKMLGTIHLEQLRFSQCSLLSQVFLVLLCCYADGQASKLEKKSATLQKDPPTKDTCLQQYIRL